MNTENNRRESVGALYGLAQAALLGVFLVFVHRGVQEIPPLTFAALSTLLGALPPLIWLLRSRSWHEYKNRQMYIPLCIVALCSSVLPYGMLFLGASMTSGLNTAM